MSGYYAGYAVVALMLLVGVVFVLVAFTANRLLRPAVPSPQKRLAYECGVDPVGEGWAQTHVRYYVYAFLYVVFAVDAVYLFPWVTVVEKYGWATLAEMGVFLGVLAVGLLHAARRGVLRWL